MDQYKGLATLSSRSYQLPEQYESQRSTLQEKINNYTEEHYPNGSCAVYPEKDKYFTICIVNDRWNPKNYW